MNEKILKLMERGSKSLGSKYALLGGAMTWISESNLVSAMCNSGVFGVLASGAMDGDQLKYEIIATQQKTSRNFGVNVIVMNPKIQDLIYVCGERKVSHVFLAGGLPDKSTIDKIHGYGMQAIAFAPALAIARRLFKQGVDALVIEGHEAGGHVGPLTTMVLIQDILLNLKEYPIFVAGGILRGEIVATLLQLGAAGCQLGTVFACCKESIAHDAFKTAFLKASGRSAVLPVQLDKKFHVSPVRALENIGTDEFVEKQREILEKFGRGEVGTVDGKLSLERFWAGSLRRAVREGDVDRGSLMAGQIVELVRSEKSIDEIISTLLQEADSYLESLN